MIMWSGMKELTEVSKEKIEELNKAQKEARTADFIGKAAGAASLILTFAYIIFLYWGHILDTTNLAVRIGIAIGLLVLILVTTYYLPVFLKTARKYRTYSILYKNTYLKPILEASFQKGEYQDYAKISLKDMMDFALFKKSRSAQANDCVTGTYKGIDFSRYDLALKYGKGNAESDCVLIACELHTGIKGDVQVIQNSFKIGGESYEQPDNHQKYLSGSESFDKKFDVYATEEKEAEKLLSSKLMKNFEKLFAKGTIAAFIDGKHAYLVISRKKDVMEAPLYSPMDPKRCEKEASIEVDIIRNWIELLKN